MTKAVFRLVLIFTTFSFYSLHPSDRSFFTISFKQQTNALETYDFFLQINWKYSEFYTSFGKWDEFIGSWSRFGRLKRLELHCCCCYYYCCWLFVERLNSSCLLGSKAFLGNTAKCAPGNRSSLVCGPQASNKTHI